MRYPGPAPEADPARASVGEREVGGRTEERRKHRRRSARRISWRSLRVWSVRARDEHDELTECECAERILALAREERERACEKELESKKKHARLIEEQRKEREKREKREAVRKKS